jgi:hypothetical protein
MIPMPRLQELLKAKIRSEMTQQVKLSEKVLPSIAQIDIYQTYKLLTAVTLSDSGNIMVCGFQDSIIKVFNLTADSTSTEQRDFVTTRDIYL